MFIKALLPQTKLFPLEYKTNSLSLSVGDLVTVPFRNKQITGIIWETNITPQHKNHKEIMAKITHKYPQITNDSKTNIESNIAYNIGLTNIKFINIAANYYLSDLGTVAKMVLPVELNEKPYITISQKIQTSLFKLAILSQEQQKTLDLISQTSKITLLKGVTGSGKTEIYFHLIAKILQQNLQILLLMPEIALSTHIIERFIDRFGFNPAIWNSSVTKSEKKKILRGILTNEVKIVIGTRSSLFLPYPSLSLIIVDEEHDQSYKQENNIMYNARDMAVMRGHITNIPVILGSATPSLETIYNVRQGKYRIFELKSRFGSSVLPNIHIIDMKKEKLAKDVWLSPSLKSAIMQTLKINKQVLLFLNRRGYAPLILCRNCGFRFMCLSCSSWLVFHKLKNRLECHHCGSIKMLQPHCPECQEQTLIACGPGVERIAEEIRNIFPKQQIAIITKEETDTIAKSNELFNKIINNEINIIIGTQILTKGFHFPHLTLVGIIDADLGSNGGDLRASEKTYQLLNQVGGRAGREHTKGDVYIQTYYPDSLLLKYLVNFQDSKFIDYEMDIRANNNMPPFTKSAIISVISTSEQKAHEAAKKIVQTFRPTPNLRLLGPAPALLHKLKGKYRFKILLIFDRKINIHNHIKTWPKLFQLTKTITLKIDIDPYNFH